VTHHFARPVHLRTPITAVVLAALLFASLAPPTLSHAGGPITFVVNSAGDANDLYLGDEVCCTVPFTDTCTLRAAVQEANYLAEHGETSTIVINIQALTIEPASALPAIISNLDITGAGAGATIVDYAGAAPSWVFSIGAGHTVEMEGLTIQGGMSSGIVNQGNLTLRLAEVTGNHSNADGGGILSNLAGALFNLYDTTVADNAAANEGGGIYAAGGSNVRIERSTLSGNTALRGGGLMLKGSGVVVNATLSGNSSTDIAQHNGAALHFAAAGTTDRIDIINTTIAGNVAPAGGSAAAFVHVGAAGSFALVNYSVLADNTNGNCHFTRTYAEDYDIDDDGSCYFSGHAIGADPLLLPLADNGGPTQTRRPAPGSPAIDAGPMSGCNLNAVVLTEDQRGWPRPLDGNHDGTARCDLGAVEVGWDVFLPLILRNWP